MAGGLGDVVNISWFSRIKNSITGIGIGALLFLVSFIILWWNEGRAVQTARSLAEGKGITLSVGADKVDPANDGKLIHLSGEAVTDETLTDDKFKVVSPKTIRLWRKVEMYQWKETIEEKRKRNVGGGETVQREPKYSKDWSENVINSADFVDSSKSNPNTMPFRTKEWMATDVDVGAFSLPPDLVRSIGGQKALPYTKKQFDELPVELAKDMKIVEDSYLYRAAPSSGGEPGNPTVGDIRVKFVVVRPTVVSILAQQTKDTLQSYQTKAGDALIRLSMGRLSKDQMFSQLEAENTMFTWGLRLAGWFVMGLGIFLAFRPLVVLADVIPFFGGMVGFGIFLVAAVVSLGLSLITIALAWLFFRPILAIGLLIAGVVIAGGIIWFVRSRSVAAPAKQ